MIQELGNKSVILLTTMGIVNLVFFSYSLRHSSKEFTPTKSLIWEIMLAAIAVIYYFLPIDFKPEDFSPIWHLEMVVFCLLLTQTLFFIAMGLGLITIPNMKNQLIRKRFWMFLLGLIMFEMVIISTVLRNGQFATGIVLLVLGL